MTVLGANILIRAVPGRRVWQLLIDVYAGQGVRIFAPDGAFHEAEKYLSPLLKKRGEPHADLSVSLEHLRNAIQPVTPELYAAFTNLASACPVEARCAVLTRNIRDFDFPEQVGPSGKGHAL